MFVPKITNWISISSFVFFSSSINKISCDCMVKPVCYRLLSRRSLWWQTVEELVFKQVLFHYHFINTSLYLLVFSLHTIHFVTKQVVNCKMEGKFVALSVLMMSLLMVQIQVEAKICCPSQNARNAYIVCDYTPKIPQFVCLFSTGCTKVSDNGRCPSGSIYNRLENSGDAVNEYCKLGCASSVCSAMTTLKNSDASETVGGDVEKCINTCSILFTKGFVKPALETA